MGLLEIINKTWLGNFVRSKADLVLATDPDNIYAENIRSFFGVSTTIAKSMCNFAVFCGHFTKHKGYICPNTNCRKIIIDFPFDKILDEQDLECINCVLKDESESNWDISQLETIEFYRLNGREYASS